MKTTSEDLKLSSTCTVVFADDIPYLPEYKSQLQHLFLLLISRVCLILRMLRILRSKSRMESETSPVWAWSRMVVHGAAHA